MYASLKQLVSLELETLKTILNITEFRTFNGLYQQANATRTINPNTQILDLHADFILNVRLRGDKRNANCQRWIHLGALIEGSRATDSILRSSYSLVLFKKDNIDSPVIRKLHFDYEALSTRNSGEPKPSSHLQMCGKASPHLLKQGFNEQRLNSLYPSFEQPRIPSMPTSLALLLDWLFTEFQTDRHALAIHRSRQWKNQVIEAERIVLKPYFQQAAAHIGSENHNSMPLVRQIFYGLT